MQQTTKTSKVFGLLMAGITVTALLTACGAGSSNDATDNSSDTMRTTVSPTDSGGSTMDSLPPLDSTATQRPEVRKT